MGSQGLQAPCVEEVRGWSPQGPADSDTTCEHLKTADGQGSPQHLCSDVVKESSHWGRRHVRKRCVLRKERKQNGGDVESGIAGDTAGDMLSGGTPWQRRDTPTGLRLPHTRAGTRLRDCTRVWPTPGRGGPWGTVAHGRPIPKQGHPCGTAATGDPHWCRGKQGRSGRKPLGWWPQPAAPPATSRRGLGDCGNTCGGGGG